MNKTVMVSGGFDPIHIGHVALIREAAKFGDVIVALNSDEWLMRKKGFVFMPFAERKAVLVNIVGVHGVRAFDDSEDNACAAIRDIQPDIFCNGGDRDKDSTPTVEAETLWEETCGVMMHGIGGAFKIQSSSALAKKPNEIVRRNWGTYEVLDEGEGYKVKRLVLDEGKSISLQRHKHRAEHWIVVSGVAGVIEGDHKYNMVANESIYVEAGFMHKLTNVSNIPLVVIEVQTGDYLEEDDIERFE